MTQIEIIHEAEIEGGRGWEYLAQVLEDDGSLHRYRLRLSWADYNHWSAGGADAPARVAEAALAFVLSLRPSTGVPDSFDASIARRISRDADEVIPRLIRDSGAM